MPNTREKLIELIGDVQSFGCKHTYEETASSMGFRENAEVADHLIANGVEIPVRCKDCKHLKYGYQCYYPLGMMLNNDGDAYVLVDPDEDFCSRGERRAGE